MCKAWVKSWVNMYIINHVKDQDLVPMGNWQRTPGQAQKGQVFLWSTYKYLQMIDLCVQLSLSCFSIDTSEDWLTHSHYHIHMYFVLICWSSGLVCHWSHSIRVYTPQQTSAFLCMCLLFLQCHCPFLNSLTIPSQVKAPNHIGHSKLSVGECLHCKKRHKISEKIKGCPFTLWAFNNWAHKIN